MTFIKSVGRIAKLPRGRGHRGVDDPLAALAINDTWVLERDMGTDTVPPFDVIITVPAGEEWRVDAVRVEWITGPAGVARLVQLFIETPALAIAFRTKVTATQAANLTRYYHFSYDVADLAAFRDTDYLTTPIPRFQLQTGWRIRITDANAAGMADDVTVRMLHGTRLIG